METSRDFKTKKFLCNIGVTNIKILGVVSEVSLTMMAGGMQTKRAMMEM
jgi:hypothetical protein